MFTFFNHYDFSDKVLASEIPRVGGRFPHGTVDGFLMERLSVSSWNGCRFPQERLPVSSWNGPRFPHGTVPGFLMERLARVRRVGTAASARSPRRRPYGRHGGVRRFAYTASGFPMNNFHFSHGTAYGFPMERPPFSHGTAYDFLLDSHGLSQSYVTTLLV